VDDSKTRLEKSANPCCGYVTDTAGDLNSDFLDDAVPNVGDLSICFNCGSLLVYVDGARNKTRSAKRDDIERLNSKQRKLMGKAQKYIRRRGLLHPDGLS